MCAEAAGVTAAVALVEEEAGAAILTAERRADLTVMGACGLTARGPLGLGSVTERVLRASATPHLVVNRSLQTVREGRAERGRRAP